MITHAKCPKNQQKVKKDYKNRQMNIILAKN